MENESNKIRSLEEEINMILFDLKKGYSTPPLDDQLDELIDRLILLSRCLKDGMHPPMRNRELQILLDISSTEVGEEAWPLQFSIKDHRPIVIDETLAKILRDLAESLVLFKRQYSLHFHDKEIIDLIKRYRSKIERRLSWSQQESNRFLILLDEEFPDQKSRDTILRFLQWLHSFVWPQNTGIHQQYPPSYIPKDDEI